MKKILALALALIMVLGLATTASAATITNAGDHQYEVYQIFTGDLSEGVLSNVVWGKNGTGTINTAVDANILTELEGVANGTDVEQLAVITKYVNLNTDPYGTVAAKGVLSDVPNGYYLIKDVDGSVTDNDSYTLYIVEIVDDVTITPKGDTPEVEKKVDDKNDSNTAEDAENWQDSADYDIGDNVPFKITATLPTNYNEYKVYYLTFVDTMSKGLTYNEDAKVYFGETDISSYFTITHATDANGITTITIVSTNLKDITGLTNSSEIVVEYTAKLNESADIGNPGNSNKVKIQYTNDPNWDGNGDKPTGETPEDTVVVFTYELNVDKVNESNAPLAGAGFTLYKKNADGEYVAVGAEITGEALTKFTWTGLDDGDYKLVETTTPAGYNTIADIEFTITATHDTEADEPKLITLTTTLPEATTDKDAGTVNGSVMNQAGATLPETGGMGTTLFYVIGGLLVAAAVVLLVTKKRMASAE